MPRTKSLQSNRTRPDCRKWSNSLPLLVAVLFGGWLATPPVGAQTLELPASRLTLDPFAATDSRATDTAPRSATSDVLTSALAVKPTEDVFSPILYPCACGCGIFDVGTSSMLPHGQGGMLWEEWDFQNQNQNRHGASKAPSSDNDDKDVRTHFLTSPRIS